MVWFHCLGCSGLTDVVVYLGGHDVAPLDAQAGSSLLLLWTAVEDMT